MVGVGIASQRLSGQEFINEFVKAPGKALDTTEKFPYHYHLYDNMSLSYIHILLQTGQCTVVSSSLCISYHLLSLRGQ